MGNDVMTGSQVMAGLRRIMGDDPRVSMVEGVEGDGDPLLEYKWTMGGNVKVELVNTPGQVADTLFHAARLKKPGFEDWEGIRERDFVGVVQRIVKAMKMVRGGSSTFQVVGAKLDSRGFLDIDLEYVRGNVKTSDDLARDMEAAVMGPSGHGDGGILKALSNTDDAYAALVWGHPTDVRGKPTIKEVGVGVGPEDANESTLPRPGDPLTEGKARGPVKGGGRGYWSKVEKKGTLKKKERRAKGKDIERSRRYEDVQSRLQAEGIHVADLIELLARLDEAGVMPFDRTLEALSEIRSEMGSLND